MMKLPSWADAQRQPTGPVSARSGGKEFIELDCANLAQADAVLPADTEAP